MIGNCKAYYRIHGDNTKSYMVMVHAAISCISQKYASHSQFVPYSKQICAKQQMISSLHWLLENVLQNPKTYKHIIDNFCVVTTVGDKNSFIQNAKAILKSCFMGRFSNVVVDQLAELVLEMILTICKNCVIDFESAVNYCEKYFERLCFEAAGPFFNVSKVVDGLLLVKNSRSIPLMNADSYQQAVFAMFDDTFCSASSAVIENDSDNAANFFEFPMKVMNEWIEKLNFLGVSVLFFQGKTMESFRFLCESKSLILFDCIAVDDMLFLLECLKCQPLLDITDLLDERSMVSLKLSEISVCNDSYLLLQKTSFGNEIQPCSLMLCSPSPGLCSQYKQSVCSSILVLRNWLSCNILGVEVGTGYAVKGNGHFHLQLFNYLQNADTVMKVLGKSWNGNEIEMYSAALPVISELLLAIPKTLHGNSTDPKDITHRFIDKIIHFGSEKDSCSTSEHLIGDILHPLNSQIALVSHVIQSICQLLRINDIVS